MSDLYAMEVEPINFGSRMPRKEKIVHIENQVCNRKFRKSPGRCLGRTYFIEEVPPDKIKFLCISCGKKHISPKEKIKDLKWVYPTKQWLEKLFYEAINKIP